MFNLTNSSLPLNESLNVLSVVATLSLGSIGILFNIIICYMVISSKDLQQPLHIMIANLAITDILYCLAVNVGAILAISITDNQEESYSSGKQDYLKFGLASSFISSFSASNSMITLSFISFERYRGIVSPLSVSVSKRKIWIYIIGIWIYALICSGIVTILRATDTYQIAGFSIVLIPSDALTAFILVLVFTIFSVSLPSLVILFCYVRIILKLCRNNPPLDDSYYKLKIMKSIKRRKICIASLLIMTILSACSFIPFLVSWIWISSLYLQESKFAYESFIQFNNLLYTTSYIMFIPGILLNVIMCYLMFSNKDLQQPPYIMIADLAITDISNCLTTRIHTIPAVSTIENAYHVIIHPLSVPVSESKIWINHIGIWIYTLACSGIIIVMCSTDSYQNIGFSIVLITIHALTELI
ncbi:rhodopsin [Trichoplax sp. H2]|nr:rhodopsin [Trichoplax sp. H2]|eukprot:RDD38203.1 rhodopsin [Trichoplax sp. H2]